ncbi:AAA family ATPase [Sedimentisphaera salicampi]|uniref:DNA primase n=1 Tax=Sedimentisphaera salicampi TaxID=1941349 RepID=A0A1W6LPK4_9BACT|nr:AAA family ATPase [Sedimentisphaera salicampi]ARN57704.1 DNA primase [Sedimentisphaera salicampi]
MGFADLRKRDRTALAAELEAAGAQLKGDSCCCPFHEDKHPSAGIYQNEAGFWMYKCHSCGFCGSVWDVEAKGRGETAPELIKAAQRNSGAANSSKNGRMGKGVKIFPDIESLKAACPGTIEAVYKYTCPETRRIEMVVIRSQTQQGKTFRQARPAAQGGFELKAPPKPWPLYNRTRIRQADSVIVVEGEKCVHKLTEHGYIATTSPGGAGKAALADWQPLAGKNIILWPDADQQGRKHAEQVAEILAKLEPAPRISKIEPLMLDIEGKGDVCDYLEMAVNRCKASPAEALQHAVQFAEPEGVSSGVLKRIEDTISGKIEAIRWPFDLLSRLTNSLIPGTVTLLCGSPGASKSFVLLQALSYWIQSGVKACVYELEEDREFHLMRALAQLSELPQLTNPEWIKDNGELAREAYESGSEALEAIGRQLWTSPQLQLTLQQLAAWTQERAKAGFRIITIDPVTAAAQASKPWIEDAAFMQRIKAAATDFGCSVVLVTHPAKTVSLPDLNQLAGGAAYGRFAQTAFWLEAHEPKESRIITGCGGAEYQHNRTMHIIKARNGKGHGLEFACDFDSETLSLKEIGIISKKKKKKKNA